MDITEGHRIVEIKNGKVMSLFHGTNRSRVIPIDVWHKANIKTVKEGTNGKPYMSGWHFLKSKADADSFFERMFRAKENRYVIRCYVRGNIRPKSNSKRGSCLLADEIMIKKEDVKNGQD
jgi:hypothetical protein